MPLTKFKKRRKAQPIDLIRVMNGSKPWWQSTTIISAVVGLVNVLTMALKLEVTEAETQGIIQAIIAIVATAGVVRGRMKAKEVIK